MVELKILIVDDEKPARHKIAKILSTEFEYLTLLEAENGVEAVELIKSENPDLIFLDIQMPGFTGFEVIMEVGVENMPYVIFVTAYDQYAIDAFEVQAIDYLLKPFDKHRLLKAFYQARERFEKNTNSHSDIQELLEKLSQNKKFKTRLLIKDVHSHKFVNTSDIIFMEVKEKYIDIQTMDKTFLLRESISSMEEQLNPQTFRRVNRSTIINMDFIKEIQPWSHGDYLIILSTGAKIKLSRKYSQKILNDD